MFEGFTSTRIESEGVGIALRHGGSGPPLLLLHGHPQTHVMWHRIAPRLAERFTVICPDLRGYGDSDKPETTPDHAPYSKRAMARDAVAVMRTLGFERFAVVGHDRGGRVAYRLALDWPERVAALSVLDIVPTAEHFRRTDAAFATGYFHWFFLAQPAPLPENLIAGDPDTFYLRRGRHLFAPEALAEYRRCYTDPATIHAMCEDYRAAVAIDWPLDEADRQAGRRIACPVLALWGAKGSMGTWYDVLGIWRDWAGEVQGGAVDCGHYLAEEAPDETLGWLLPFLEANAAR
jgi:haloacetate dehalogenase